MKSLFLKAAILTISLIMVSCGHDVVTPFQGRMNIGSIPPQCKNSKGESLVILEKENRESRWYVKGAGCLTKDIRSLWATSQNEKTFAWNEATLKKFYLFDKGKNEFKFKGEYEAGFKPFLQLWTMEYHHTLDEGTVEKPIKVTIDFKKTFGTSHISHWQGVIVLEKMGENLTEFSMLNEIKASRTGMDKAEGAIRDTFQRLNSEAPNWQHLNLP